MVHFMWQDDICGVAVFIKECLGVYYGIDPDGGQASDQPWVAEKDVKFLSLSSCISVTASKWQSHPILLVLNAWLLYTLALLIKEAATVQDLRNS